MLLSVVVEGGKYERALHSCGIRMSRAMDILLVAKAIRPILSFLLSKKSEYSVTYPLDDSELAESARQNRAGWAVRTKNRMVALLWYIKGGLDFFVFLIYSPRVRSW